VKALLFPDIPTEAMRSRFFSIHAGGKRRNTVPLVS
jgi:hypothetical protein